MTATQSTPDISTETKEQQFWQAVAEMPFIIPDDAPLFIRCEKCGLNVLRKYKTCPACGRDLTKGKG